MGNIFDLALVLVVVVCCAICCILGIFKTLKPFRKMAAFLLAWNFKSAGFVKDITSKLIKVDNVKAYVNTKVDSLWGEKIQVATEATGVPLEQRYDDVFGFFGQLFGNIKQFCVSLYNNNYGEGIAENVRLTLEEFTSTAVNYISGFVLDIACAILGFVLVYIFAWLFFLIVTHLLDGFFSRGLFGAVNRIAGGAVGLVFGLLIAWGCSIVMVNIVPVVFPVTQEVVCSGNYGIVNWFYNDFLLSGLFGIQNLSI